MVSDICIDTYGIFANGIRPFQNLIDAFGYNFVLARVRVIYSDEVDTTPQEPSGMTQLPVVSD